MHDNNSQISRDVSKLGNVAKNILLKNGKLTSNMQSMLSDSQSAGDIKQKALI